MTSMKVTLFKNRYAQAGSVRETTWPEFCAKIKNVPTYSDKDDQPLMKLAIFENNSRAAGSKLLKIWGIEIDYDAGIIPMAEAAERLKSTNIEAILCSTFSATSEDHRWRAFIPLSKESNAEHRSTWVAAADEALGKIAASESYTSNQIFYYGRGGNDYEVIHCSGEYLDTLPDMIKAADDYAATGQEKPKPKPAVGGAHPTSYSDSNKLEELRSALSALDSGDYVTWEQVMFGMAGELGEAGYPVFDEWSRPAAKYDPAENHKRYMSCLGMNKTLKTVFGMARDVGWKWSRNTNSSASNYSTKEPYRQQGVKQERHQSATAGDHIKLVSGLSITPRCLEWLWKDYLPKGKLALLVGAPKVAKTMLALSIAATTTVGGKFPDGTQAKIGKVLFWSGEDDLDDTIVPRLKAMGANLGNMLFIDNANMSGQRRPFSPSDDMPMLLDTLERLEDHEKPSLLIIDPIVSVTKEMNNALEVRRGLEPVVQMAQKFKMAVLGITHFRKSKGESGLGEQIIGSSAFLQVARTVFYAVKPPDSGEQRVFFRGDTNIAGADEGFMYEVETMDADFPEHDMVVETAGVCWGEKVSGDELQEMIDPDKKSDSAPAKVQAEDFLKNFLSQGRKLQKDVKAAAKEAGITPRTLDRAKKALNINSEKEQIKNGPWWWWLPEPEPEPATEHCQSDPVGNLGDVGDLGNLQTDNRETEEHIF